MHRARTLHNAQAALRPFNAFRVEKRTAKVTMDREVRYWSAMYSEVPATGIVNNAPTKPTAAQRASGSRKHSPLNRQHASNVRKVESRYQMNIVRSKERCDARTLAAIISSKNVSRAWFRKNSAPKG